MVPRARHGGPTETHTVCWARQLSAAPDRTVPRSSQVQSLKAGPAFAKRAQLATQATRRPITDTPLDGRALTGMLPGFLCDLSSTMWGNLTDPATLHGKQACRLRRSFRRRREVWRQARGEQPRQCKAGGGVLIGYSAPYESFPLKDSCFKPRENSKGEEGQCQAVPVRCVYSRWPLPTSRPRRQACTGS